MSNKPHMQSIGCDVKNCAYNENGTVCTAQHISVENNKATTQAETYCYTLCRKYGNCQ